MIGMISSEKNNNEVSRTQAKDFIAQFNRDFPSEKYLFDTSLDELLYYWIF